MKTNRRRVIAQPTPALAARQPCSRANSTRSTFAHGLCGAARRAAGIVTKLTLLWLFALPLFAHAVVQAPSPVASLFTVTSPTATATLPNVTVPGGYPARLLVVTASNTFYGNVAAVSFGTTAMTKAVQISDGFGSDSIWVLPLGSGDAVTASIRATYSSLGSSGVTAHAYVSAVMFFGVDQAVPTSSPVIAATQTGASTLTVASAVGDLVYDVADFYSTLTAGPAVYMGPGQTQVAAQLGTVQFGTTAYRNSSEPGAASVTMSWSGNANAVAHAAINIRQAPRQT